MEEKNNIKGKKMGILKYSISRSKYEIGKYLRKKKYTINKDIQDTVIQIKENGYALVPDFYTQQECADLRNEIDGLIKKRTQQKSLWVDPYGSDKRCFAAEDDSKLIETFYSNKYLKSVADNVFEAEMLCSNTLAARVDYKGGNIGSGQGWHRDGNHFQFKALVYLSDVEIKDGPFNLIIGSHKTKSILENIKINKHDGLNCRFTSQEIDKIISKKINTIRTFTAKAGTVVLFDSSCIHAGGTLTRGGLRYALTNYYFPSYVDMDARKEMFKNAHKIKDNRT